MEKGDVVGRGLRAVGDLLLPFQPWVLRPLLGAGLACGLVAGAAAAGTIDTDFLQRPWPHQMVRELEVGRDVVRWRQRVSWREGLFAGVAFTAPMDGQRAWELATDYTGVGRMTPGVTAVRFLERTPTRQVIQLDVKVLWKQLRVTFEVEQDPPRAIRFHLVNSGLGEYRGVCWFEPEAKGTRIELATWLRPSRPVPLGVLSVAERMVLLQGVRSFLANH